MIRNRLSLALLASALLALLAAEWPECVFVAPRIASAQGDDAASSSAPTSDATAPDGTTPASDPDPASANAEGTGAVSATEHPESYLDFAVAGGKLMVPIGICSLLWLTFLVERLFALRSSRVIPQALVRGIEDMVRSGEMETGRVEALLAHHPSSASRVLGVAHEHLDEDRETIAAAVDNAAQREIHVLHRYLRLFSVLAGVAPLLGLLGTVTGMIQAFREVAIRGLGSGQALAPGIYQALITTAAGLIVAIPALVTHHWFESRIETLVHRINALVVDFVEAFRGRGQTLRRGASGAPGTAGARPTAERVS